MNAACLATGVRRRGVVIVQPHLRNVQDEAAALSRGQNVLGRKNYLHTDRRSPPIDMAVSVGNLLGGEPVPPSDIEKSVAFSDAVRGQIADYGIAALR